MVKYNIGLKTLLQPGTLEQVFYGDLVYKFKRIVGNPNFSDQIVIKIKLYQNVINNMDIMRKTAGLWL